MGVVSISRICSPMQHKKNIVEGTVLGIFRSTSTIKKFDKTLEEKENIKLKIINLKIKLLELSRKL